MMKTLAYILGGILLSGIVGYISYRDCGKLKYQTAVTVMIDITEKDFIALPETSSITNYFGVSKSIWDGFYFRLRTISDVEITPVFEADLEPQCEYVNNIFKRKKQANEFMEKMKNAIEESKRMASGRKRSYIYVPMVSELNRLAKFQAQQRILIVYSDLMELSPLMNFYDKRQLKMLKQHTEKVAEKLQNELAVLDLTGIKIHFVFQPHNSQESEKYSVISKFFKQFFESKGATVEISANL